MLFEASLEQCWDMIKYLTYRGVDIEGDRIGKRCSIDGYKDNVFGEDGRLVDGDSTARSTGHVRAHATVADHFVD